MRFTISPDPNHTTAMFKTLFIKWADMVYIPRITPSYIDGRIRSGKFVEIEEPMSAFYRNTLDSEIGRYHDIGLLPPEGFVERYSRRDDGNRRVMIPASVRPKNLTIESNASFNSRNVACTMTMCNDTLPPFPLNKALRAKYTPLDKQGNPIDGLVIAMTSRPKAGDPEIVRWSAHVDIDNRRVNLDQVKDVLGVDFFKDVFPKGDFNNFNQLAYETVKIYGGDL